MWRCWLTNWVGTGLRLDWYAGMTAGNVEEFRAAEQGEQALRAVVEREAKGILERLDGDPADLLGESYELADADLAAMSNEMITRTLREMIREALLPGEHGWVDDDLAFVKSWGVDPRTITVPVTVRYAEADTLVGPRPLARGEHPGRNRGTRAQRSPGLHRPRPDRPSVPVARRALNVGPGGRASIRPSAAEVEHCSPRGSSPELI
jgi:hypothetical protein